MTMVRASDRARRALLDSAEELFARDGIDAVSNRRIVENAGAANHSAVAYHFGGREGLLRALLDRHSGPMRMRRAELMKALGHRPGVHDIVRCRMLPLFELLDELPRPSWRARFLAQLQSVPSAQEIAAESARASGVDEDVGLVRRATTGIPDEVLQARFRLLGHLVVGVCAEQESLIGEGTHRGSWEQVGRFLIDAAAGMLAAPVSDPAEEPYAPVLTGPEY